MTWHELRLKPKKVSEFRERQLIQGLLAAKENKEIAFDAGLSSGTVKLYLHLLCRKYGVPNRVGLALLALKKENHENVSVDASVRPDGVCGAEGESFMQAGSA